MRYLIGRNLFAINCELHEKTKTITCEVVFGKEKRESIERLLDKDTNTRYFIKNPPDLKTPAYNVQLDIVDIER